MSEPKIVTVPRDLYYHEVAYVRGLENAIKEAIEVLEKGAPTNLIIEQLRAAIGAKR